jgi:hypothetical protein
MYKFHFRMPELRSRDPGAERIEYQEAQDCLRFGFPRNLSNHMDRQARTGDTVTVKS